MKVFTKRVQHADQAGAEAAGLAWLGEVDQARDAVVRVVAVEGLEISTERIDTAAPSAQAAREFGRKLRMIHDAGADAFGAPPSGWTGANYIGRITQECTPTDNWSRFYTQQRVLPFATRAGLGAEQLVQVQRACAAIDATLFDAPPARIHGDLWAGNVLFGPQGAVMIDPAAHGGHPHTDLGMLSLFGVPYFTDILAGYGAPADIERWLPMHQLHPLAVHALTHGPAYHEPLARAARLTLEALE